MLHLLRSLAMREDLYKVADRIPDDTSL